MLTPQMFGLLLAPQAAMPDTVLTRVVQDRDLFAYVSVTLEIVVLLLGAIALGTLIWVLLAVRKAAERAEKSMKTIAEDARPILRNASAMTDDARETVARLRNDVERVTDAASAVSDQLLDAAEVTARRIDEVNAVIDVVQDALEDVAISSVAAMRGVQVGASEMATAFKPHRTTRRRVSRSVVEELESRRRQLDAPDEVEPG